MVNNFNDYCGFFNNGKLIVTGKFNTETNNYAPYIGKHSIDKFSFILRNENVAKRFRNENCITFNLSNFSGIVNELRKYHCNIENIQIKNKTTPGYPGDSFTKLNTNTPQKIEKNSETEYMTNNTLPENTVNKAFIEEFKDKLILKNSDDIEKLFLPSIKEVYMRFAKENSAICVLDIEPDWIHYDDFVSHGMIDFWNYAFNNPNKDCYLVFNRINITIPRSGLQPLFDVLNGVRPQLPFSNFKGIPHNLTLIATILNQNTPFQLSNPIESSLFDNWHFINSDYQEKSLDNIFDSCGEV